MLTVGATTRVFVGRDPVDMRGSFDALAGRVRALGLDPLDGHLYLFFNRTRRLVAVLWFDQTGWCLLRKRLERGTFQIPGIPDGVDRVTVDGGVLTALLSGIDLRAPRRRWYDRRAAARS